MTFKRTHAHRHEGLDPVATSAKVEESGGCRDGWGRCHNTEVRVHTHVPL